MAIKRPWTEDELSHARQMVLLGFNYRTIGEKLGRSRTSVAAALNPRVRTEQCVDCSTPIFAGTKTGRCRKCKNIYIGTVPEYREAKAEGVRRKWREDPCFAAKMRLVFRQVGRENGTDPVRRAKLVEHGYRMLPAMQTPEAIAKRKAMGPAVGRKLHERRLGWCPKEYLAEYTRLTESKRMLAHEARAIIMDQVKADRAKLSPFERQQRALEKGGQLVANDRGPMFGEALKAVGE